MAYGLLTVDRHHELQQRGVHLHVFFRGVDVTDRCIAADDTPGLEWGTLYKLDPAGRKYFDPDTRRLAVEIIEGTDIEIRPVFTV